MANTYLLLHLIPVEDAVRLSHQFSKWAALEKKSDRGENKDEDIKKLREVIHLFTKMHDDKFDGEDLGIGLQNFKDLYQNQDHFNTLYTDPNQPDVDKLAGTRRGLREIMRYGHMPLLNGMVGGVKITNGEVTTIMEKEAIKNGASYIPTLQKKRRYLHKVATKQITGIIFNSGDYSMYNDYVLEISKHRGQAAHVKLLNHVKLHRLLTRVISRLVDYSGLWERDLYFITLALVKLENTSLKQLFDNNDMRSNFRKEGKVDWDNISRAGVKCLVDKFHTVKHRKIRNDIAHFNMLQKDKLPLNFTKEINNVRVLMSYDRKLKNAVSKSIIEMLDHEGFYLTWQIGNSHQLTNANTTSRTIEHIKKACKNIGKPTIIENFHDVRYQDEDHCHMKAEGLKNRNIFRPTLLV